jgi:hypothetical protein
MKTGDFPTSHANLAEGRVGLRFKMGNRKLGPAILPNAHPKREPSIHNFNLVCKFTFRRLK